MPKAYILFNTVPEAEDELLQELRNTKGVIAADSVYGIYDFVAIVEAESLEEIFEYDKQARIQAEKVIKSIN